MGISFRHSAGFGKRMEYHLIGQMLMEGLDVYLPLVDDHGVDCVIKREDGTFIEIQIKARSNDVTEGDAALFAAISGISRSSLSEKTEMSSNALHRLWNLQKSTSTLKTHLKNKWRQLCSTNTKQKIHAQQPLSLTRMKTESLQTSSSLADATET